MTNTETHPVTTAEITEFCAAIEASTATFFAKHYANLTPPKFYADPKGRKYIRIVCENQFRNTGPNSYTSRSVHCFVERDTGLIWKAAGWKAPARNFSRGSIRGDRSYALRRC